MTVTVDYALYATDGSMVDWTCAKLEDFRPDFRFSLLWARCRIKVIWLFVEIMWSVIDWCTEFVHYLLTLVIRNVKKKKKEYFAL